MFEHHSKLQFCDVDMDNTATNHGLLRIMQEASSYHSALVGYGPNDTSKKHIAWFMISQRLKVFSRPCWSEDLTIKTWSRGAKGVTYLRDFQTLDNHNNTVCVSSSKWVILDCLKGTPIRPSNEIINAYGTYDLSVFSDAPKRLREPVSSEKTFEYKIQKRDIDINNHVNNLFYLDFACEALPISMRDTKFSNIQVEYKKEIFLNDVINCFYSETDGEHIVTIKLKDSDFAHAIVKLSL